MGHHIEAEGGQPSEREGKTGNSGFELRLTDGYLRRDANKFERAIGVAAGNGATMASGHARLVINLPPRATGYE